MKGQLVLTFGPMSYCSLVLYLLTMFLMVSTGIQTCPTIFSSQWTRGQKHCSSIFFVSLGWTYIYIYIYICIQHYHSLCLYIYRHYIVIHRSRSFHLIWLSLDNSRELSWFHTLDIVVLVHQIITLAIPVFVFCLSSYVIAKILDIWNEQEKLTYKNKNISFLLLFFQFKFNLIIKSRKKIKYLKI